MLSTVTRRSGTLDTPAALSPVDEADLVQRCRAGQRAAHDELYQRFRRQVAANLYRVLGDASELDDLVQDVFVIAFRGLDGFRTTTDQQHAVDPLRRALDEPVGQGLGGLAAEETGMRVGKPTGLARDRLAYCWMAMAQARDRGAAAGIEESAAVAGRQPNAIAMLGDWHRRIAAAVKKVRHIGVRLKSCFNVCY